jgi:HEAT repeat protein
VIGQILVPATAANALIFALLSILLVAKKLGRTRREQASSVRRERFRTLLEAAGEGAWARISAEARGSAEAMGDLLAVLLDPAWRARARACSGSEPFSAARVGEIAASDASRRGRAALVLGCLSPPDAPRLLEPMLRDVDYDVRHAVIRALVLTEHEHAAWSLVRGLRDDLVPYERVLEHLGPWAAEAFAEALHIGELRPIRAIIAEGLGFCEDVHAGPAIAGVLSRGDEEERIRACRAIGRTGDPRLGVYLTKALHDHAWTVRAQAAASLARLGNAVPDAIEELSQLLSDQAWWVRANAAEALLAAGPAGIEALRTAAHSQDRFARERSREALEIHAVRARAAA